MLDGADDTDGGASDIYGCKGAFKNAFCAAPDRSSRILIFCRPLTGITRDVPQGDWVCEYNWFCEITSGWFKTDVFEKLWGINWEIVCDATSGLVGGNIWWAPAGMEAFIELAGR